VGTWVSVWLLITDNHLVNIHKLPWDIVGVIDIAADKHSVGPIEERGDFKGTTAWGSSIFILRCPLSNLWCELFKKLNDGRAQPPISADGESMFLVLVLKTPCRTLFSKYTLKDIRRLRW
jgi:hypothetical protein